VALAPSTSVAWKRTGRHAAVGLPWAGLRATARGRRRRKRPGQTVGALPAKLYAADQS